MPENPNQPSEEKYLNCIRCGLCLVVCPTYREYLTETSSPRGRVALARKGLEGDLELSPNLLEQMYACFDCMACNEICPVGIHPAELALDMRALYEKSHPKTWKKALFDTLLPRPARLELATWPLRLYQALGLRRLVYVLGLRRLLPAKLRDMETMLPHLPQRPLRQVLPAVTPAQGAIPPAGGLLPRLRPKPALRRGERRQCACVGPQRQHRRHPPRDRLLRHAGPWFRQG